MRSRRALAGALCALAAAMGAGAPGAQAAFDDPLFVYSPTVGVPPLGGLSGPCGLAVDQASNVYLSDYYHDAVDVFSAAPTYRTQLANADPDNGPCGLAVDSEGRLYVNRYHGAVSRFTPSAYPPGAATEYVSEESIDPGEATGVAVNTATDALYVNRRDHLAVYGADGTLLQTIGLGSLTDGYGVAVSRFSATNGRLYVPDAATDTVKVFDPATSTTTPAAVISGPPGGFRSLRDAAVAVDDVSGHLYVAERISSPFTERPQSTIQVFDAAGTYKGHLKHNVIDGAPVGLAVDNTINDVIQGRVYVTSGNTSGASLYAYPPGAATNAPPAPPLNETSAATGARSGGGGEPAAATAATPAAAGGPASASEIAQKGSLRVDVQGSFSPRRLPRTQDAPISVSVGWRVASTDGAQPPKLKALRIEINRAGHLDLTGLPTCPYAKIQPASTARALANCRPALVGRGSFSALVTLGEQESYLARGQMLIFNGRQGKRPVLWAQIYSAAPFASSFVIPFGLSTAGRGRYGSVLAATLPASLRAWGSIVEVQMRLSRRFRHRGERRSFLSASCPAPEGFTRAIFPLARASFAFVGGQRLSSTLTRSCATRG
ncbi:MAG TPA: NHL repeat-containing protein [Solirubrobacterales bacterium]|nr:NHL repeat-containing protein [Solirubrobacterales bacterium]